MNNRITPRRRRPTDKVLVFWLALVAVVLALAVAGLASAHFIPRPSSAQPRGVFKCGKVLASLADPATPISKKDAERIALDVCRDWRDGKSGTELQYFYRAVVSGAKTGVRK